MKIKLFILLTILAIISGCAEKSLSNKIALETIESYLNQHPIYDTAIFIPGKVKLRQSKDKELITTYTILNNQGYLSFGEISNRKKWLSKDTIWEATLSLTTKAHPYIVDQKNNKITLQTHIYTIPETAHLKVDRKGKKSALVTVMLQKKPTVFSVLKKDKNPHIDIISRQFKLKLSNNNMYEVVK